MSFLSYTQAAGNGATSLSPAYPANASDNILIAWVNVLRTDGGLTSPVCTAPGGWTLIVNNGSLGLGVYRAAWRKLGDGSTGSAAFSFDTAIRGNIIITCDDQIDSATLIDASSFHNDSISSNPHTASSVSTTVANCVLRAMWASADTSISFTDSADLPNTRVSLAGTTGSAERPTLIGDAVQASTGASGGKSANSNASSLCQEILVAIRPYPGPSVPTVIYPNGGESLTAGASVTLNCTVSTHPTIAVGSLQYEYSYSTNYGSSWTTIGLSSAGVTSKTWTVASVLGSGNLIRVRAYDGTLYSAAYDESNAPFSIVTEVAPAAPVITSPTAGSVQAKSAALAIAWVHQGGSGNPQTKFTLQWSRDNFASHTVTIGPTTTATQSTTIDVSAEADGATISVKVKTTGLTLDSPYSAVDSFLVSNPPATPNITAPTAGSPPTTPLPTVTFTSGSFVARKMRVVKTAVEVYNSEVASTATSFTSGYSFANGVAVTLYLSVKNVYGVWSAEDSETFTPVYTGPSVPTAVYTEVDAAGYVLIQITNPSTPPSYNEIWRRVIGDNTIPIRVSPSLPVNGSYADNSGASGQAYIYFVRAYAVSGLFSDSVDSAEQTLDLPNLFLHAVSRTNTNSNVSGIASSIMNISGGHSYNEASAQVNLLGRNAPGVIRGQAKWETLPVTVFMGSLTDETGLNNFFAIWRAQKPPTNAVLLVRDNLGNRFFGKMSKPQVNAAYSGYTATFEIEQTEYTEAI